MSTEPTMSAFPQTKIEPHRPVKTKVPPRRISGDDLVIEIPSLEDPEMFDTAYPHIGEWFEVLGSMTVADFEDQQRMGLIAMRREEMEKKIRELAEMTEGVESEEDLNDEQREAVAALRAEVEDIMGLIDSMSTRQRAILAKRIVRCAWTDDFGIPIGRPTGEHTSDGVPICTIDTAEDLAPLPLWEMQWLQAQMQGAMGQRVRAGNSDS